MWCWRPCLDTRLNGSLYLVLPSPPPAELRIAVPSAQGHPDLFRVLAGENRNTRAEPWLGLPGAELTRSIVISQDKVGYAAETNNP